MGPHHNNGFGGLRRFRFSDFPIKDVLIIFIKYFKNLRR